MSSLFYNSLMNLFEARRPAHGRGLLGVSDGSTLRVAGRVWGEVAAARGLSLSGDGTLAIVGDAQGVRCELAVEVEGPGAFRTLGHARRSASLAGYLRVEPAAPLRSVLASVMGRRLRTGDVAFDRAYLATASDPSAGSLLDEATRAALLAVRGRGAMLDVQRDRIELSMEGVELVHETLHDLIDLFVRLGGPRPTDPYRNAARA